MPRYISKKLILVLVIMMLAPIFPFNFHAPLARAAECDVDISDQFPDPKFLECVSFTAGRDGTLVCEQDMPIITSLKCANYGSVTVIDDANGGIQGINLLTALTNIDFGGNNITDLSPLSGLTELTNVYLSNNSIENLTPLSGLTNIMDLVLRNDGLMRGSPYRNIVTDTTPLGSFSNLTYLDLYGNNVSNLSGLNGMTSLGYADLSNNNISNLNTATWSNLTNLWALYMGNDYSPFEILNNNSITNINALNGLTDNLQELRLYENNIVDLSGINWSKFTNIGILNLRSNDISNITPLADAGAAFANRNSINIKWNTGLPTQDNFQAGLDAVAVLEGNGALVTHDIGWENCFDGIDNDGNGMTDDEDPYCFPNSIYIDYSKRLGGGFGSLFSTYAAGVIGCGTESNPCKDFAEASSQAWVGQMATMPPYDGITVYIKGDGGTVHDPEFLASIDPRSGEPLPIEYARTEIWPGYTHAKISSAILVAGPNVTVQGYEISGYTDVPGIVVLGAEDAVIKNNYIHGMGAGIVTLSGKNVTIENNILSENRGNIDLNAIGLGFGFPAFPACGGIAIAGSDGTKVINNTLYNNCDEYVFSDDILSPAIKLGDLAVASLSFLPISRTTNTMIKQNLVFNNITGMGRVDPYAYTFDLNGELVNGVQVNVPVYDGTAAGLGNGNNFSEKLIDPFFSAPARNYSSAANDFSLNNPTSYQTCSIAPETPNKDFAGNRRPDGPVEAGAIESPGGSCVAGGGSRFTPPVACAIPGKIDLPNELSVIINREGNPIVDLNWSKAKISLDDFDTETKTEIFLKYLKLNPTISINGNTKKLINVFARYMFQDIAKSISPTLKKSFENNLHYYTDREIGVIKDILKEIGIQNIFSDWWPYLAMHVIKTNSDAGRIFTESLKESLYITTKNLFISIDRSKEPIPTLAIWRDFMAAFVKNLMARLEKETLTSKSSQFNSAVKCISSNTNEALSSIDNKFYNPFKANAVTYYNSLEKEVINFMSKISEGNKRKIDNALNVIIKEGVLKVVLESILYDSNLINSTQRALDMRLNELISLWSRHPGIKNLIDFYQGNDKFLTYKNLIFDTSYFTKLEKCIENNYRNELIEILKEVRYGIIYNIFNKNNNYNDDEAKLIMDIIARIKSENTAKESVNMLIVQFMEYLSSISKQENDIDADILRRIIENEISIKVSPDFNQFYKNESGTTKIEIIENITTEIYRGVLSKDKIDNAKLIAKIVNPNITSYIDRNIPPNTSDKAIDYAYYIIANTNCASVTGSSGKASISPIVPNGIPIPNVFLNLKIENKKGMSQMFMERLEKLLKTNNTAQTNLAASNIQIQDSDVCMQSKVNLISGELTGDTILNYILECLSYTQEIDKKILHQKENIIPPLFLILKQINKSKFEETIEGFMNNIFEKIENQIETEILAQEGLSLLYPFYSILLSKNSLNDFNAEEKMLIKCLGHTDCDEEIMQIAEDLFSGYSHATNIIIEKYKKNSEEKEVFSVRVDIFGEANNIPIGEFISGEEYTLKIKLAYFDEITGETKYVKYVLPKISNVIIKNAQFSPSGLTAYLNLGFNKPFQYGNFFDADDVIDIKDVIAWGDLIKNNPEKWEHSNIDGLAGINLFDILTFQENWGEIQIVDPEDGIIEKVKWNNLINLFGL